MATIIGIDLGTTNSVVAVMEGGEPRSTPPEWGTAFNRSPVPCGQFGVGGETGGYWRLSYPGASTETRERSKLDAGNRLRWI